MKKKERITKEDCVYAAGFFDGEGCVRAGFRTVEQPKYSFVVLQIVQQDPKILYVLKDKFNVGNVKTRERNDVHGTRSYISMLTVQNHGDIKKFAKCILPYTKTKREELVLAVDFCNLHYQRTEEAKNRRLGIIKEMRILKQQHKKDAEDAYKK